MFLVVLLLTVAFLALFWLASAHLFSDLSGINPPEGVDSKTVVGGTVLGLAMFATLFLGTVLAVFLTLGAVRGDAERGLLQPLVVRPIGRATFLLARFLGAAAVCALYVAVVYAVAMLIVGKEGHWWPDRIVAPAVELSLAVCVLVAISLLGSVFLSATANGVAVFMVFGAGLVGGLLGQIGHALNSGTLRTIGRDSSWVLPFEALYQDALHRITASSAGLTSFVVRLGPFGGAQSGSAWLWPWVAVYLALVGAAAIAGFARRDL
jgi:ABC-type transport system involved in multi-copper enzyme maturation permease subunit